MIKLSLGFDIIPFIFCLYFPQLFLFLKWLYQRYRGHTWHFPEATEKGFVQVCQPWIEIHQRTPGYSQNVCGSQDQDYMLFGNWDDTSSPVFAATGLVISVKSSDAMKVNNAGFISPQKNHWVCFPLLITVHLREERYCMLWKCFMCLWLIEHTKRLNRPIYLSRRIK